MYSVPELLYKPKKHKKAHNSQKAIIIFISNSIAIKETPLMDKTSSIFIKISFY